MAEGEKPGPTPVDLEKELTCSICTDLLYQPLTLLDCLHTFCGACLKEWFAFQASTATSPHPYTCPSCRASVRTTQPNATVTTLLDMFIRANPHRGKSEEEKKADREKFKYGDVVMPKLRRRGGDEAVQEEEERRVLEEVQALSLREVGIEAGNGSGSNTLEPPRERRRRERSRDRRDRSQDTRRSADDRRSRSRNPPTPASREVVPPRAVEHQSSLRSLLSASELDSQEMEEEIMRQIMEEGLLDGIDLNNIDVAQEDEISERIAQAYRRRQAERQRERRERRERLAREGRIDASGHSTPPEIRSPPSDAEQTRRRAHGRSESGTSTPRDRDNRPPVSRPGLLDVANQGGRTRHHRSSSQGSSRSSRSERIERPAPITVSSSRSANVSSADLGTRPATSGSGTPTRRRQSDNQQRSTLEERQQFRNSLQAHPSSNPNSPHRSAFNIATTTESPTSAVAVVAAPLASPPITSPSTAPSQPPTSRRTTDPTGVRQARPSNHHSPPMTSPPLFPRSTTDPSIGQPRSRPSSVVAPAAPTQYPEPNVSCNSCGKEHIEYELHYNCSRCDSGNFNLCLSCYRRSKGCKHWFGFGWAAWPNYQRRAPKPSGYPPGYEFPHILRGYRYRRSQAPLTETSSPGTLMSEDNPAQRLEVGVFCDTCQAYANSCFWKCDYCNEGEWGYCNDCVNQGKHCTHALLPITHVGKEHDPTVAPAAAVQPSSPRPDHLSPPYPIDDSPPATPPETPKSASIIGGPGHVTLATFTFRPLTFTTLCNICTYPIPPSHTRFHCLRCNGGDYDICSPCYQKLVVSGRISKEDGMHGWRRCLRGHRMIVVGFEDRDGGQRRVIVRDLVGGLSLKDDVETAEPSGSPTAPRQKEDKWTWRDTDGSRHHFRSPHSHASPTQPQRFPPDGGVGLRVQARWSYFPAEGVTDELSFPKFAEITEAEDINGDWFWGVYAGAKGLFPGAYGRIVGGNVERQGVI